MILNNTLTLPNLSKSYINERDESEAMISTSPSIDLHRSFVRENANNKKSQFLQVSKQNN